MQERRASPRIRMRHKVGVLLSSGEIVYLWTYDMSVSGLQLLSEYSADIGDSLRIVMSVLDPQTDEYAQIRATVYVVRIVYDGAERCFRVGVDFSEFEGDGKEIFGRFLDARVYSRYGQHLIQE